MDLYCNHMHTEDQCGHRSTSQPFIHSIGNLFCLLPLMNVNASVNVGTVVSQLLASQSSSFEIKIHSLTNPILSTKYDRPKSGHQDHALRKHHPKPSKEVRSSKDSRTQHHSHRSHELRQKPKSSKEVKNYQVTTERKELSRGRTEVKVKIRQWIEKTAVKIMPSRRR